MICFKLIVLQVMKQTYYGEEAQNQGFFPKEFVLCSGQICPVNFARLHLHNPVEDDALAEITQT